MNKNIIGLILLLAALIILPFFLQSFYLHLALNTIIWVILALSLNIIMGFIGELNFGHAAFYGIGAYTSTLISMKLGLPLPVSILAGALAAGLVSIIIGFPSFQTKGHYFALVTLGFGELVRLVLVNWEGLTNGPIGIRSVPSLGLGNNEKAYYFLFLLICILVYLFVLRLHSSYVGQAFQAIHEDPFLAESIGIPVKRYKLLGFFFSATIGGLAGALMAHFIGYISPDQFDINATMTMVLMVIAGGAGSTWGPVVGAVLLSFIPETLHAVEQYRTGVYGIILVLIIIFLPNGLAGLGKNMLLRKYLKFVNQNSGIANNSPLE